jgi:hypothetical protein
MAKLDKRKLQKLEKKYPRVEVGHKGVDDDVWEAHFRAIERWEREGWSSDAAIQRGRPQKRRTFLAAHITNFTQVRGLAEQGAPSQFGYGRTRHIREATQSQRRSEVNEEQIKQWNDAPGARGGKDEQGKKGYTKEQFEQRLLEKADEDKQKKAELKEKSEKASARMAWLADGGSEADFEKQWPTMRDEARRQRLMGAEHRVYEAYRASRTSRI